MCALSERVLNINEQYHRNSPPRRLAKKHGVELWALDNFLSVAECDGLLQVQGTRLEHAKSSEHPALFCMPSVGALHEFMSGLGAADFTPGTTCVNETISRKLARKEEVSHSLSFYNGESPFAAQFAARVQKATGLKQDLGGKFQLTRYSTRGYDDHTDCTVGGQDGARNRSATILVYLEDTAEGGDTVFPELGVRVRPKKGSAIVWNNMDHRGRCIPESVHNAAAVGSGSRKSILQRWYYWQHFEGLGSRPQEPEVYYILCCCSCVRTAWVRS
jgi:hypothetical protein